MSHHRSRPSSPSPKLAHPLENDDLLHEILLRLPPQPPHLLRVSVVSKRWRRLATDPNFLRRFRIHHRRPPLLDDFSYQCGKFLFRSTLDPPYHIPPKRFSLRPKGTDGYLCLDVRHGRVLFHDWMQRRLIVWDPITDYYRLLADPPQHGSGIMDVHSGAVLCAAGDQGHVHGACHSTPFKVALLNSYPHQHESLSFATVYSSETRIWSDILSTPLPYSAIYFSDTSTLVGNTLHWLLARSSTVSGILAFDLDRQTLAVINRPPSIHHNVTVQIIQAQDGDVGLAALSCTPVMFGRGRSRGMVCRGRSSGMVLPHGRGRSIYHQLCLQIWERKANCNGVAVWELCKSVELRKILGSGSNDVDMERSRIVHYAEDLHAIFARVHSSLFMVQLNTMQSKELFKLDPFSSYQYHPSSTRLHHGSTAFRTSKVVCQRQNHYR